jgi:hypothetical protein
VVVLLFTIFTLSWIIYSISNQKIDDYPSYFNSNLAIYGKGLPKKMHFCNDTLPLDNVEVKNSIQKEFYESGLLKNKSTILLLFSRCERWFPFIEPILKKHNLPDDIKYIAVIESHLSNTTSPMGAKGFWQLLPQTAQTFGLEVNDFIDQRLDVELSTNAACRYLKYAYNELKNWTLVAAAYNYGINGIKFQLEKQNVSSYHQLKLNKETKEFVYRIIAYKTLLTYPEHFGIKRKIFIRNKIQFRNITIDSTITNIAYLSKHFNCPTLVLKAFNAWLLGNSLPNPEKKSYTFKIPINTKADYSAYIADLLGYPYNDINSSNENISTSVLDSANLQNQINYNKKISE